MADLSTLLDAATNDKASTNRSHKDVLDLILQANPTTLGAMSRDAGDPGLQAVSQCSCIQHLRRIITVNAHSLPSNLNFEQFSARLRGGKYGRIQHRRRAR